MSSDKVWYWHIHHAVLLEPLTDTAEARRKVIRASKDAHERATRLLWMQPVLTPYHGRSSTRSGTRRGS